MRFVIVTGMSGAGKSSVLKMLEDVGYFCMDNLPVSLVPKLTELLSMPNSSIDKVALGMDIRCLLYTSDQDVLLLSSSNYNLLSEY